MKIFKIEVGEKIGKPQMATGMSMFRLLSTKIVACFRMPPNPNDDWLSDTALFFFPTTIPLTPDVWLGNKILNFLSVQYTQGKLFFEKHGSCRIIHSNVFITYKPISWTIILNFSVLQCSFSSRVIATPQ